MSFKYACGSFQNANLLVFCQFPVFCQIIDVLWLNGYNRRMIWKVRTKTLTLGNPTWMGIVNVTPDSFSDGGRFLEPSAAVKQALQLIEEGVDIIDLGGESTRPGSDGISAAEELHRILPVLRQLRKSQPNLPISVDTTKTEVAREVLAAGADIINDVSGLSDPEMIAVLRETGAGYCLMHTQGVPKTMQDDPQYDDVVGEVFEFLKNRRKMLMESGIEPETIAIDPGLGFGKTLEHNWQLIEKIAYFHRLGAPILVGHSRKRFIAERFADREEGTRLVSRQLIECGVHILRVHKVPSDCVLPNMSNVSLCRQKMRGT